MHRRTIPAQPRSAHARLAPGAGRSAALHCPAWSAGRVAGTVLLDRSRRALVHARARAVRDARLPRRADCFGSAPTSSGCRAPPIELDATAATRTRTVSAPALDRRRIPKAHQPPTRSWRPLRSNAGVLLQSHLPHVRSSLVSWWLCQQQPLIRTLRDGTRGTRCLTRLIRSDLSAAGQRDASCSDAPIALGPHRPVPAPSAAIRTRRFRSILDFERRLPDLIQRSMHPTARNPPASCSIPVAF
jgi:hypothetical protein